MSRVEEIRARMEYARRAFSWLGAAGVAKDDVMYLLGVAEAAERVRGIVQQHGNDIVQVDGLGLLELLKRLEAALDRASPSAAVATGGARPGAALPLPPVPAQRVELNRRRRPF